MKVTALAECRFWNPSTGYEVHARGEVFELDPQYQTMALSERWVEPLQSTEDAAAGAPPREKAAARHAPEIGRRRLNGR